jgi:hypothetical protein
MPLLLNVLRNADGPEYRKLRVKAMECAGLIGQLPSLRLYSFCTDALSSNRRRQRNFWIRCQHSRRALDTNPECVFAGV